MGMREIVPAILLTAYNMILIKLYLDAVLANKGWRRSMAGWMPFTVWEINRVLHVLGVGTKGILTKQTPGWNLFLNVVVLGTVGLFSYAGRLWKRLLFPAVYVALLTSVEALVVFGAEYMGAESASIAVYLMISNAIMLLLVLGIRCFMRKKDLDVIDPSDGRLLLLAVIAGIILYYAYYRLAREVKIDNVEIMLWLCISALMFLALDLCIYPICRKLAEAVWTKRRNHEHLKQIALYKDHREREKEVREEVGRMKHDLKQSMVYLSHLLSHQEYGKMKEVLDSLCGELEEKGGLEGKSGNLALDSLISHLSQESKKYGIELHVDLEIAEELRLEDIEICAMAGNLFDNAVEASKMISEGRKIWVDLRYDKGYLQFQVKNRYNKTTQRDNNGDIKSDKEGLHGFGLRSVKRIVHKYHGHMEISEDDAVFCVNIRAFC